MTVAVKGSGQVYVSAGGSAMVSPAVAPAWWTSLADATWVAIAGGASFGAAYQNGNRIVDVAPSNYASYAGSLTDIVNAFTGGCAAPATYEVLLACNGGHSAYAGNEIYALQLNQAVPGYALLLGHSTLANTASNNPGVNAAYCANLDNTPRAHHNWFQDCCSTAGIISVGQASPRDDGTGTQQSARWTIARGNGATITDTWKYSGRVFISNTDGGSDGTIDNGSNWLWQTHPNAYDPVTDLMWVCPAGDANTSTHPVRGIPLTTVYNAGSQPTTGVNYTPSMTKVGPNYGTQFNHRAWSWISSDTSPRYWSIYDDSGNLQVFDVSTPGSTFTSRTPTGSGTNANTQGVNCFYDSANKAALVFGIEHGATVSALKRTGSNPSTASYAWSDLTNGGGSDTPTHSDTGIFNNTWGKAQGIVMPDGRIALVICSNVQSGAGAYVYKVPLSY